MYKKILVPLDGSGLAEMALYHAEALALEFKSQLVLLRVVISPYRDCPRPGPVGHRVRGTRPARASAAVPAGGQRYAALRA
ncbi:MAG: universal stress protein [Anaerolineae bacterium]|nr:MAG: universal stress protein [Anaerolineae bacterium]